MPGARLKDGFLGDCQTAGQPKGEGQPGKGRESENHGKGVTGQLDRGYDIQRRGKPKARARESEGGRGWQTLSTPNSTGPAQPYIPGAIITTSPPLNTIEAGHHLRIQPPSTPSTPFHAPPSPYQPQARLEHHHPCIQLCPITAALISPPPTLPTRPASHTVPPKRCRRRRYPPIQPHRPILAPKPCVRVLQKTPERNVPLPFPVVNPSQKPPKPRPNEILTVPNAQSHLQYIDAMHNPPPPRTPLQPLTNSPPASRN